MRLLLLTLPLALLPFAPAHANEHTHGHEHDEHASLDAHEHGSASLNIALEGNSLELELDSPAMNLLGFEHAAHSTADRAKLASVKRLLESLAGGDDEAFGFGNGVETLLDDGARQAPR